MLWDVFWTHRSPEIVTWLREEYPNLILLFVPPSCTPVLAPLDVDFNGPWKQSMIFLCQSWLSQFVNSQFAAGKAAADIHIPLRKTQLVPHFTGWLHANVLKFSKDTTLIKRAFSKVGNMVAPRGTVDSISAIHGICFVQGS